MSNIKSLWLTLEKLDEETGVEVRSELSVQPAFKGGSFDLGTGSMVLYLGDYSKYSAYLDLYEPGRADVSIEYEDSEAKKTSSLYTWFSRVGIEKQNDDLWSVTLRLA